VKKEQKKKEEEVKKMKEVKNEEQKEVEMEEEEEEEKAINWNHLRETFGDSEVTAAHCNENAAYGDQRRTVMKVPLVFFCPSSFSSFSPLFPLSFPSFSSSFFSPTLSLSPLVSRLC